ncbi:MAG: DNA-3-methyladenine glycosylase 2 [Chroococcidiopsidaceae cyanobacterium CP_BM_ER_R8_30]|nr:DNA-3-methyladenine glycosylase 2 [Chroococcidiopsidaceae cyanobacterium CP_BM_ER_R8_30]
MILEADICYQAILTRDARFDGVFFVGISTTKIYCRTVCTAKRPRRESCTFYPSAAAAEQAGFRPCLLCRPELAPGNARIDAVSRLAAVAFNRIEDGILTEMSINELANEMGISDRHLRRAIKSEFGVSPIALVQTQRLLLAKRLLTDTALPVTEVAFASGFSSLRRFNALFKERYRLHPTALRRARIPELPQETLLCEVAYRPPLDWGEILSFLGKRIYRGVEVVDGNRYLRTVTWKQHRGWVAVEPSKRKHALRVELSASLASVLLPMLARVKRLFDLAAAPQQIAAHLGSLATAHPGLRVPGAFDGFELAVRAILGQRVSVKVATTLAGRFVTLFGEPIETPFTQLTHLPPVVEHVATAEPEALVSIGIPQVRANSILALARAVAEGRLVLEPGADVQQTIARLKELPGIGEWTAQYIAMRALSWPDAFPHTDLGICKALNENNPKRVLQLAESWRPWRSYAAIHLWQSLETL